MKLFSIISLFCGIIVIVRSENLCKSKSKLIFINQNNPDSLLYDFIIGKCLDCQEWPKGVLHYAWVWGDHALNKLIGKSAYNLRPGPKINTLLAQYF